MTDENLIGTEILESDLDAADPLGAPTDTQESVYDSARAVMEEMSEPEDDNEATDKQLQGGKSEEIKQPSNKEASEAARTLARSKGKKRQVIENPGKQGTEGQVASTEGVEPVAAKPVDPPQGWTVAAKEWFAKQPKEAQEEHKRIYDNLYGHFTKTSQELAREKAEVKDVADILRHYRPSWNANGITDAQAIAELCATKENIKTKPVETLARLCSLTGTTPQALHDYLQSGQVTAPQQQAAPTQNNLTLDKIRDLIRNEVQQPQVQAAEKAAMDEIEGIRREMGPDGKYKFPELWDANAHSANYWNAAHLKRVLQLVDSFRETNPNTPIGELTRHALSALRVPLGATGSPSPTGQRLTPEQELAKVRSASVSVKPRGNGAIPITEQAKKGESVRDSAEAVYAMFRNNSY